VLDVDLGFPISDEKYQDHTKDVGDMYPPLTEGTRWKPKQIEIMCRSRWSDSVGWRVGK